MNISDQSHMLTSGTTHSLSTLDSWGPTHTDPLSCLTHASGPLLLPLPLTRPLSATLYFGWLPSCHYPDHSLGEAFTDDPIGNTLSVFQSTH